MGAELDTVINKTGVKCNLFENRYEKKEVSQK